MVDDGRYRLLSRPRFIGSPRINRNGWDSGIPAAFHTGPEPSTTGLIPSPSESRDSERLDSSRCLARALASQVMATQQLQRLDRCSHARTSPHIEWPVAPVRTHGRPGSDQVVSQSLRVPFGRWRDDAARVVCSSLIRCPRRSVHRSELETS
jgi:hypothetical protein